MDHSRLANEEQEGPYRSFIRTGLEGNPSVLGPAIRLWHGKGKSVSTFRQRKRAIDKLCGITGWRLHDLRRTIVSGMARLGIPPTSPTRSSTIKPARFRGSRPCTRDTTF